MTAAFGRPPALPPVVGPRRAHPLPLLHRPGAGGRPGLDDPAAGGGEPRPGRRPGRRHRLPQDPRWAEVLAEAAPGARASLWLDPDRQLVGNLDTLLARWLLPQDLALWRHEDSDWRAMAERHLVEGKAPAAAILAQAARFAAAGVPGAPRRLRHRHGLAPARRRRRRGALRRLVGSAGRRRPAPTTSRSTACSPRIPRALRPAILPARLGTAADNAFVARLARGPLAPPAGGAARPAAAGRLPQRGAASPTSPRPSCAAGSSAPWSPRPSPTTTSASPRTRRGVRDAVVVLTKGAMETSTPRRSPPSAGATSPPSAAGTTSAPSPPRRGPSTRT